MSEELQNIEASTPESVASAQPAPAETLAPEESAMEAAIDHRARILRRIGFSIFGGIIVVVGGFLIYSAFHDIGQKTVYDPFTGENVMKE